jgi:hypothetical protein
MADNLIAGRTGPKAPGRGAPSLYTLIGRTFSIALTNLVTLNGVTRLGWNAVPLVLMFILEGVTVLFSDFIKRLFDKGGKDTKGVFVIECVFILFYGFFALIVFGPYSSLQSAVDDGFRLQRELISGELRLSLAALVFMRLVRLGHDLADSGAFGGKVRRTLQLEGGGWMLLLFLAVMLAPLIAKSGPNPAGGLAALVVLKALGEVFSVWAVRIKGLQPKSAVKNNRKRSF